MSSFRRAERNADSIKKVRSAEDVNDFYSREPRLGRSSKRSVPSIQINNDDCYSFTRRRSSVSESLNNFNIRVVNNRRYSEVILSPTEIVRRDYFKTSESTVSRINSRISNVFGNLSRRLRLRNQISQNKESDSQADSIEPSTRKPIKEANEAVISKRFSNPLEDSFDGNEKIKYESSEFLEQDEEIEYEDLEDGYSRAYDYGRKSFENEPNDGAKSLPQRKTPELVLAPSMFGSPISEPYGNGTDYRRRSDELDALSPRRESNFRLLLFFSIINLVYNMQLT